MFIEEGIFEVIIGEKKKILKAGDRYYVQPHIIHGVTCLEAGLLIDPFNPYREDFAKK